MRFEKGDILFAEYNKSKELHYGYIAIFSSEYSNSMDRLGYDVMLSVTGALLFDSSCSGGDFRLATYSEKQILFDALAKENKHYCEKTKTIKEMKKEFTKKDLKSGMWVELSDGKMMLCIGECETEIYGKDICLISDGSFRTLQFFNEDLTNKKIGGVSIDKVFYDKVGGRTFSFGSQPLIWERETEEDKQMKEMQVKLEEMKKAYKELEESITSITKQLKDFKE